MVRPNNKTFTANLSSSTANKYLIERIKTKATNNFACSYWILGWPQSEKNPLPISNESHLLKWLQVNEKQKCMSCAILE